MSSPGQRRGSCGHAMANFDGHSFCARCHEKGKGEEPCVANKDTTDCKLCNSLTPEQLSQLATPSYKIKKEKRESKRSESANPTDDTLVDPSAVEVIGVVRDAQSSQATSVPPEKKAKKLPSKSKKVVTPSSADSKISDLDQKWSERFSRIEALLLSKSFQPSFSSEVRVSPTHTPPAGIRKDSEPFFQPVNSSPEKRTGPDIHASTHKSAGKLKTGTIDQGQPSSERTGPDTHASQHKSAGKPKSDSHRLRTSASGRTGPDIAEKHQSAGKPSSDQHQADSLHSDSDPAVSKPQPFSKLLSDRPRTDRPGTSFIAGSESPPLQLSERRDSISSVDSQADSDISDRPPVHLFVEEADLSEDQDFMETDQPSSEEQTYRETMSGIRSFMGWTHVPEMDSSNPSDDNPFAGPKAPAPNKISVQMPTEEWLCKKLGRLNVTLIEGYPSRTTEAGHLSMDQFLRPARSQNKWYGLYPGQSTDPSVVSCWNTGPSKLNSSFSRIARKTGMTSIPPASRRISQDTLRKWERSAREASVICNQAASFNRCLFKVQQEMQSQLKTIRGESKGKVSKKISEASDELQFLMTFNNSITQAAAKSMEHLTDFIFITMGNSTLARRDAYLSHLNNGIKPDTFAALRTAPLQGGTLFPDAIIKKAEEEISHYDNRGQSASFGRNKLRYHPYERSETKKQDSRSEGKQDRPAWKNIGRGQFKRGRGRSTNFSSRGVKGQQSYK